MAGHVLIDALVGRRVEEEEEEEAEDERPRTFTRTIALSPSDLCNHGELEHGIVTRRTGRSAVNNHMLFRQ